MIPSYWPHFVCGIPVNWIARNIICPLVGHKWRQTIQGIWYGERIYGRQCRRCWAGQPCPCLGCARTRHACEEKDKVNGLASTTNWL